MNEFDSQPENEDPLEQEEAQLADEDEEEEDDDDAPAFQIKIQNVVASISLGCPIDLNKVATTVKNAEYNPQRFHAVIMRIREPRTTALIFRSGKMIVTGAKTENDCLNGAKKYTAILQKVGLPATLNDFKVQNITATFDMGFPIRLEAFLYAYSVQSTYEPELFPGLIYRLAQPKVVLLIFVSGKIVLTGAKNNEAILLAAQEVSAQLSEFRKTNTILTSVAR